jgi:hypothetical protein
LTGYNDVEVGNVVPDASKRSAKSLTERNQRVLALGRAELWEEEFHAVIEQVKVAGIPGINFPEVRDDCLDFGVTGVWNRHSALLSLVKHNVEVQRMAKA